MIYGPSRGGTQDFQRCPKLYDYKKRWTPVPEFNPAMVMGNAIHAGLAEAYRAVSNPSGEILATAAYRTFHEQWQVDQPGTLPDVAWKMVTRAIKDALSIPLLQGSWSKVVYVESEEHPLGPEQCHPDLVIEHTGIAGGGLEVIDWKFSLTLNAEYVAKKLASYETLWQLWHYAWRVQEEFDIPVTKISVVQMAGGPKPFARYVSFPVSQESITMWHEDAKAWWRLMEFGFNGRNLDGCWKFGENHLCPFYAGCWSLAGDETRFDTLYIRRNGE